MSASCIADFLLLVHKRQLQQPLKRNSLLSMVIGGPTHYMYIPSLVEIYIFSHWSHYSSIILHTYMFYYL